MSGAGGGGRELLQLRFHFGERDRDGDGPLEAAVMDACAHRGIEAAALLRGVEGFGGKHHLRTDRLLSLSEDAPLVAVAVGDGEKVEALAAEIEAIAGEGLIVLEEVEGWAGATETTGTATASAAEMAEPVVADREVVKATVWGPRGGPGSPHLAVVAALRSRGAEAATVLLGVDGVLDGERRRARFVAGNRGVPALTIAVGTRTSIEAALADLEVAPPLVTFKGVERNRRYATESLHSSELGAASTEAIRVTLVTSEIAAHESHPRYLALIHALREEGAAGATALRGVWGFRGAREPHGDRVLALRRDVPVIVEAVDTPERAARWRELAESLAGDDDLVCSELPEQTFTLS